MNGVSAFGEIQQICCIIETAACFPVSHSRSLQNIMALADQEKYCYYIWVSKKSLYTRGKEMTASRMITVIRYIFVSHVCKYWRSRVELRLLLSPVFIVFWRLVHQWFKRYLSCDGVLVESVGLGRWSKEQGGNTLLSHWRQMAVLARKKPPPSPLCSGPAPGKRKFIW